MNTSDTKVTLPPDQIHPDIPPEGIEAEALGTRLGVQATSAWLIAGEMISGLRPESEFEALARRATRQAG